MYEGINFSMNQEKQQKVNRTLVIDLLRQEKLCSRADLAKLSGLKRATITNIINEFIDYGLVIEDGLLEGKKGRRSIGIRINGKKYRTIGVMVTRQYYSIGLMGLSGEVFQSKTFTIQEGSDVDFVINDMKQKVHETIEENSDANILAIGFAVPGPYEQKEGEMIFVTNLIGWDGISISPRLQEGFDIPVFIENDANAGVCAQQWFYGKKTEQRNIVYIVAGQGIGCGIIANGELLKGSQGMAGEFGHTSIDFHGEKCECGNRGCLETYCSTIVLMQHIKKKMKDIHTLSDLRQAVQRKEPVALEEYKQVCGYLAIGVVNMINQINPDNVIIGDSLAEIEPELLLYIVKEKIKERVRPIVWKNLTIEVNRMEYNPILIGAGVIAAQKVFESPFDYIK